MPGTRGSPGNTVECKTSVYRLIINTGDNEASVIYYRPTSIPKCFLYTISINIFTVTLCVWSFCPPY